MFTKLKYSNGVVVSIDTKEFYSGLYIIFNQDPATQHCSTKYKSEKDYHITMRRECIKDGGTIIDGTKIKNYKGRYKINKFERK